MPLAYFYAVDDDLAKLILRFGQLNKKQRHSILEYVEAFDLSIKHRS